MMNSRTLLVVFVVFVEVKVEEIREVCTSNRCTCFRDEENIRADCRMSDLENISQSINTPSDVNSLDLSNNNIQVVKQNMFENFSRLFSLELSHNLLEELVSNSFSGLKNLLKLSLTYNNIQVIHEGAFSGLYSLQTLNLTGNSLQVWNANDAKLHLPSLMIIDLQGNMGWRPEEKYLLELPRLKEVRNVSWAAECLDCWLIRNVSEDEIKIFNNSLYNWTGPDSCITYHYTLSDFLVLLARHRFLVRECKSSSKCIRQKETNSTISHSCWHVTQRVISGQLFFGILGGCLNLVVFFNILLSRSLRKNVSLVLVSNLALGDTLSCLYSVVIASIIVSNSYKYLHHISDSLCPKVGFLWILGQCTTSTTSVALTLERYLCIVFSMKPDIRMTPRLAFLAIAFNWVVAASLMSVALYFKMYRQNYLCIPIVYKENLPNETRYTIALGSVGIILYLVTIPLYVHIYTVVKRSSQQMGVKRESTLAKRIAMLVLSNLLFFFIPVFSLGAWMILIKSSNEKLSVYSRSAVEEWIPLYCLSVNSCLNPLVHAFRNDKFKQALRKILPFKLATSPNVTSTTGDRNVTHGNTSRVAPATQTT